MICSFLSSFDPLTITELFVHDVYSMGRRGTLSLTDIDTMIKEIYGNDYDCNVQARRYVEGVGTLNMK